MTIYLSKSDLLTKMCPRKQLFAKIFPSQNFSKFWDVPGGKKHQKLVSRWEFFFSHCSWETGCGNGLAFSNEMYNGLGYNFSSLSIRGEDELKWTKIKNGLKIRLIKAHNGQSKTYLFLSLRTIVPVSCFCSKMQRFDHFWDLILSTILTRNLVRFFPLDLFPFFQSLF